MLDFNYSNLIDRKLSLNQRVETLNFVRPACINAKFMYDARLETEILRKVNA